MIPGGPMVVSACFRLGIALAAIALALWVPDRAAAGTVTGTGCPAGQISPTLNPGIYCRYQQVSDYLPTYDGGPWIYVDLVDLVATPPKVDLSKIRAGMTGKTIYGGPWSDPSSGPRLPPIYVVHMTVCLSDPDAHYSECPNNYPFNQVPSSFDLSPQILAQLAAGLAQIRQAGLKVVLNFTYNWPCTASSGAAPPNCVGASGDAPMSVILQHMQLLSQVILPNADVVAGLHAGFLGQWGEWHSSTWGNDNTDAHNQFLDQFINLFGKSINLQVRYPYIILDYAQYRFDSRSPQMARRLPLGLHDDEFGSNSGDGGTFLPATYPGAIAYTNCELIETAGIAAQANTLTAEMTAPYTSDTLCSESYPRGDFLEFARRSALTSLHLGFPPEAWQQWDGSHRYHHILRSIGPHLSLDSAVIVELAQQLLLLVTINNTGSAAIARSRPLWLIVQRNGQTVLQQAGGADLTGATPLAPWTVEISLGNALAEPGDYALYLFAPDPKLPGDARYALRFENVGVPVLESGWNALMTLQVRQ